jgi:phage shock protein PspC (stress-responsive transcriptional regulator)
MKLATASEGIQNAKEGEKKSNPSRIAKIIQKLIAIAADIAMYFQLEKTILRLFVIGAFTNISFNLFILLG